MVEACVVKLGQHPRPKFYRWAMFKGRIVGWAAIAVAAVLAVEVIADINMYSHFPESIHAIKALIWGFVAVLALAWGWKRISSG